MTNTPPADATADVPDHVVPTVTTLCGSSRWPDAFALANMHLSLQGRIVISLGMHGHADEPRGARYLTSDGDETTLPKQQLDELHRRKIDLSDGIYVINVGGYVGSSTRREIAYARKRGNAVEWMFPDAIPTDLADAADQPAAKDPVPLDLAARPGSAAAPGQEPAPVELPDDRLLPLLRQAADDEDLDVADHELLDHHRTSGYATIARQAYQIGVALAAAGSGPPPAQVSDELVDVYGKAHAAVWRASALIKPDELVSVSRDAARAGLSAALAAAGYRVEPAQTPAPDQAEDRMLVGQAAEPSAAWTALLDQLRRCVPVDRFETAADLLCDAHSLGLAAGGRIGQTALARFGQDVLDLASPHPRSALIEVRVPDPAAEDGGDHA